MNFEFLEKYRLVKGPMKTSAGDDYGFFSIPYKANTLRVMASPMRDDRENNDLTKWQHVSVSLKNRCPNWQEMCFVKDLFFGEEETVVQFHPKRSEYVNNSDYCLHLWKKRGEEYELPPSIAVGLK